MAARTTDTVGPRHTADDIAAARDAALALGVQQGTNVRVAAFDTVFIVVGITATAGAYNAVATRDEHSAWTDAAGLVRGGQSARVDAMPLL